MPYRLTHDGWVVQQADRCKGILMQQMVNGQDYTVQELLDLLSEYGLDFSNPSYQEIGAILLADGFLEAT